MTTRSKFIIELNNPTEIELLYDEAVSGKSQYGVYHLYAVSVEGEEFSFFPTEEVHEQIKDLKKGSRIILTKLGANRNGKLIITYDVKVISKEAMQPIAQSTERINTENEPANEEGEGIYEIMILSYRQAIKITTELGCLEQSSRIAISLFIARSKQNNY